MRPPCSSPAAASAYEPNRHTPPYAAYSGLRRLLPVSVDCLSLYAHLCSRLRHDKGGTTRAPVFACDPPGERSCQPRPPANLRRPAPHAAAVFVTPDWLLLCTTATILWT